MKVYQSVDEGEASEEGEFVTFFFGKEILYYQSVFQQNFANLPCDNCCIRSEIVS